MGIGIKSPKAKLHVVGDIRATGDLIAENFIVSSSVTYMTQSFSSGSTIFGDTPADDTHQFTGSVSITGSKLNLKATGEPKFGIDGTTYATINFKESGTDQWNVGYDMDTNRFFFAEDGVGNHLILKDGGNIGIGTTTPDYKLQVSGTIAPENDNAFDLGTKDLRFANLYTADLQLSNEDTSGNEVDGTTGNWTLQEGKDDIFIINRKTGKKFRFKLEEIE